MEAVSQNSFTSLAVVGMLASSLSVVVCSMSSKGKTIELRRDNPRFTRRSTIVGYLSDKESISFEFDGTLSGIGSTDFSHVNLLVVMGNANSTILKWLFNNQNEILTIHPLVSYNLKGSSDQFILLDSVFN